MSAAEFFFFTTTALDRFRVYDQVSGERLAKLETPESGSGQTCLPLQPLALSEGRHTLGVEYADPYGTVSTRRTIEVDINAEGLPTLPLRELLAAEAEPRAGGMIRLRWSLAFADAGYANPESFEIARASDPSTILANPGYSGVSYTADLGPFGHGQTVELMVRAKTASKTGEWLSAQPVVTDAEGPPAPVILTA